MNALPDAKTVNKMKEISLDASQMAIRPPVQLPDDGFILPLKFKPGGSNFYRSGTNDRIEPVFKGSDMRVDLSDKELADHRQRIRNAFYIDQLQLQEGPQKTATEVNAIVEQQMRLLGPMLGRQQSELLQTLISRLFGVSYRRNLLKPLPAKLAKMRNLSVKYTSVIARAQRINEGMNINRALDAMVPFINLDPNAKDIIDAENGVKGVARIYGLPTTMIRGKKDIETIRKARAQAQQEMIQQQQEAHQADQAQKMAPVAQAMNQIQQTNKVGNG
jgi:hypothetical protein